MSHLNIHQSYLNHDATFEFQVLFRIYIKDYHFHLNRTFKMMMSTITPKFDTKKDKSPVILPPVAASPLIQEMEKFISIDWKICGTVIMKSGEILISMMYDVRLDIMIMNQKTEYLAQ